MVFGVEYFRLFDLFDWSKYHVNTSLNTRWARTDFVDGRLMHIGSNHGCCKACNNKLRESDEDNSDDDNLNEEDEDYSDEDSLKEEDEDYSDKDNLDEDDSNED
uniref:Uncharacterized protein n=1 Tax=Chenopodium quinoa TaxID=63459 RepID=A0A803KVG8_CHEQI